MFAAGTGQKKKEFSSSPWHYLTTHCTTNALKVKNWVTKFMPYPPYSPDHSPTECYFFKHLDNFLKGKNFYNQQDRENSFQELLNPEALDF